MNDRAIYANANALDLPIADKSVHMIATSPPYFGLRSYDTGNNKHAELGAEPLHDCLAWARGDEPCGRCYVCNLRTWGREMWRVLSDTGVLFLNLDDSYASKDLCGIPQRVVLALQSDGWYWRSKITWCKTAPMPESVRDRPTNATEEIFLLAKSARYFWDAEAVREAAARPGDIQTFGGAKARNGEITAGDPRNRNGSEQWGRTVEVGRARNMWNYWLVGPAPYAGAHYATWPPALVERMIKAGSSERGVCPECGAPWERVVDKGAAVNRPDNPNDVLPYHGGNGYNNGTGATTLHKVRQSSTTGWSPTCDHDAAPIPATVLDPFCGSGTTLLVARQLGRVGLGFDLSETYLFENCRVRLGHGQLAAWGNGIKDNGDHVDLPLFSRPLEVGLR